MAVQPKILQLMMAMEDSGMISIQQKNKLFSMKLIKATALTVSCMVSLPSFSQSYECVTGYITGHDSSGQPIYSNTYCYPTGTSGGTSDTNYYSLGIQDSGGDTDDDTGYPLPTCSLSMKTDLRIRKSTTPGCTGRPDSQFNTDKWRENRGLTIWEWLNAPIDLLYYGIWNYADFALDVLAVTLIQNNSDMNAAYDIFSYALYNECIDNFPNDMNNDDFNHCMRNAYYLLENYPTSNSMKAEFANWRLGTSLDVTDYGSSWAGVFTRDVTNYQICKETYKNWDDNGCSGSL